VRKVSWLWPCCCRKGAEQPDTQQYKLPVKEGSRAIWHTIFLTMLQTVVGREQSDLIDNTICCCTDHYLQQCKLPVKKRSTATLCTILLTMTQTIVKREQSDLMDNTICSCTDWLQHKLNNTELVESSRRAGDPDENLVYYVCETEHGSDGTNT